MKLIKETGLTRRRPEEIQALLTSYGVDFTLLFTKPVYTCAEAAIAREVPLHHELKTLLVVYRGAIALLNLPGDLRIDRRLVRLALAVREFRLANTKELAALKLGRGTISPLSLAGCRLLIDAEVLHLDWITTNAGSLTVGIKLKVRDLLSLCQPEVAQLTRGIT